MAKKGLGALSCGGWWWWCRMGFVVEFVLVWMGWSGLVTAWSFPVRPSVKKYESPHVVGVSTFGSSRTTPLVTNTFTSLHSLRPLIDDIVLSSSSSSSPKKERKLIFVGGKGGVGKTTVASTLAVTLASLDRNVKTLVVSTDPAHSLGDALDCDLRSSRGRPVRLTDALTGGRLYACEVDPDAALDSFRTSLETFDVARLSDALGVPPSVLEGLGLDELATLWERPPPGLDELVALVDVLNANNDGNDDDYDVVVVDTAPTGHTLRLLSLPTFLDGLLGRLLRVRQKLSGLATTLQTFLGDEGARARSRTLDDAVEKLELLKTTMGQMNQRLQSPTTTHFVAVTIPTQLGVAETSRLLFELEAQNIRVTDVVVNQCWGLSSSDTNEAQTTYYQRRRDAQAGWIAELQNVVDDISRSDEYRANAHNDNDDNHTIQLTKVPCYDVELTGIPALTYLADQTYRNNPAFSHLLSVPTDHHLNQKCIVCGGKGGVGKTTTSSALAIAMAHEGHKVALVSTDPAHSLGDALGMDLSSVPNNKNTPIDCFLPNAQGTLAVMEVDPSQALAQFRSLVGQLSNNNNNNNKDGANSDTWSDLGGIFDTLPPGTDEVVALAQIVTLLQDYDRIVLDTAPTGHTLRMLATPTFVADLIDRILTISQKLNANPLVKMFLANKVGGGSSGGTASTTTTTYESTVEAATEALSDFRYRMEELDDLFGDPTRTEFLVVTVPTELAVRESVRLLNDLVYDEGLPVKVRNLVVNQVLGGGLESDQPEQQARYTERMRASQETSLQTLYRAVKSCHHPPRTVRVPLLDTEPRGVFGLYALSQVLLTQESETETENVST